ncbi:hypothetical protein CFN78_02880 [Amycolatopsis antarctica]|uniref:Putative zinc-finger domain-containing protein n=1 Tax=Amycolatopsis antarctica TaxID=1854586 RepID=A0A263DCA3_9PSEU|nr:zf-HC2 domain-containing protein [Amycolatopsis antarctica]OZM75126.1 hypothetical protein CFN78_02880 [Amycolatopsis antarctica]
MTEARGWSLPESHLLPDAVVAFVDGELTLGARERAAAHAARCPGCAADIAAQRQVRSAVQDAGAPSMSDGFLASLRSIPQDTELPTAPDNLAITEDGQLVAIQRPDRFAALGGLGGAPLGSGAPLGTSAPLGNSEKVLGGRRRAAQGAGVVVSGLVLSALALVVVAPDEEGERAPVPGAPTAGVLRAQFGTTAPPAPPSSTAPPSKQVPATGSSPLSTATAAPWQAR